MASVTVTMALVTVTLALVTILGQTLATQSCDYYTDVLPNHYHMIYSPGYGGSYPLGAQCRWVARCQPFEHCLLQCSDVNLPWNENCDVDRLFISRTGDETFKTADKYCGRGNLNVVSMKNKIAIGLQASFQSPGGRFRCTVSSQAKNCTCGQKKLQPQDEIKGGASSGISTPTKCSYIQLVTLHGNKTLNLHDPENRVVGGVETPPNEYPMMAALVYTRTSAIKCGATVIDQWHLLTAAHCVHESQPAFIVAVTGIHHLESKKGNAKAKAYLVSKFIVHGKYDVTSKDYDIALVRTQDRIEFNDNVGPVCLPFGPSDSNMKGATVTMLGWGSKAFAAPSSNSLQKVNVSVIAPDTCRAKIPLLTTRQMCTYTKGKDACQSDSGGPLLYWDENFNRVYQVGIISHGKGCAEANNPGVATRITQELLRWIKKATGESYCEI